MATRKGSKADHYGLYD